MRAILTISILLAILVGCSRKSAPVITTPTDAQISEFTRNASITLPVAARPIGWREERGMDSALWMQVAMQASDLQSFLDSSPFRSATLTTNDQCHIFDFQEFLPTPPAHYRCGEHQLPNARYLKMLIDESQSTNVVVYLMWHET